MDKEVKYDCCLEHIASVPFGNGVALHLLAPSIKFAK